ncbi:MAG: hypothetical protein PCFJNLEI_01276 [Verrucomicrobiae bacterium]|nr:hypothetical protein [Verrucomicrobiae bacterium]
MIEYTIDEGQGLILVRVSGTNTCADLEKHIAEVYRDPRYKPSLKTLTFLDDGISGPIMSELPEVKRVMELAAQAPNALKKWAVVIVSDYKRLLVEFMLKGAQLKPLEVRFFKDEPAARAWLFH